MERNELQVLNELEMLLNHAVEIDSSGIYRIAKNAFELLKEQKEKIQQLNRFVNGFSKEAIVPVRCKDCKYYPCEITEYTERLTGNGDNFFCADGERG